MVIDINLDFVHNVPGRARRRRERLRKDIRGQNGDDTNDDDGEGLRVTKKVHVTTCISNFSVDWLCGRDQVSKCFHALLQRLLLC